MLAEVIFPLVSITDNASAIPSLSSIVPSYLLPEITLSRTGPTTSHVAFLSIPFWKILFLTYIIGVIFFSLRLTIQLICLFKEIRKSTPYQSNGKYNIREVNEQFPTFSFFNTIVIGQANKLSAADKELIIKHETVHADNYHSVDILLVEITRILFWFNPFVGTYKKIITNVHEFEADEKATQLHNVDQYCNLLARVALMSADFKLANHFNNSLTLKRITMMKTIKKKMNVWKVAASAMIAAGFFVAVACQDQVAKQGNELATSKDVPQEDQQKQIEHDSKIDDDVYTIVEQQADFPGGQEALYKYLGENIKFPEEARRQNAGGKVFVELTIQTDGTLSDVKIIKSAQTTFDDESLKNAHKSMDDEALRLVKLSPKWIPAKNKGVVVKSKFVLPISFAVEN